MNLNFYMMAFEDRSSPKTASSPGVNHSEQNANSPEATRMSPYTCMTIHHEDNARSYVSTPSVSPNQYVSPKVEQQERSFFRITSFALPSPRSECDRQSPMSLRSPSPADSVSSSRSSIQNEPTIQTLKYSITNILKPDFGKNAVLKTKTPPKISFKPYESCEEQKESKPFGVAPLGSLCQAVSQIGNIVAKKTPDPIPRPKSPVKLPNPEEVKKDAEGNVPQLWPAWVYCTRYSDRPSSGKRNLICFFLSDSTFQYLKRDEYVLYT